MPPKKTIAPVFRLKVTLVRVEPPVWRRVRVPGDIKLHVFHQLLQVLMGWDDCHLHRFLINGQEFAPKWSEYEMTKVRDERRTTLERAVKLAGKSFAYVYDFGDGWNHDIIVEGTLPWEKGNWVPVCLDGAGACPPEDCGGPHGYEELLKAVADTSHKRHEELNEWLNGERNIPFDPNRFDLDLVNKLLKWTARDLRRHALSR